jgi:hypothetical protein
VRINGGAADAQANWFMGQRYADEAGDMSEHDEVMGNVIGEQAADGASDEDDGGEGEDEPVHWWAALGDFDEILHCARWISSRICEQETNNVGLLSAEQRGQFGHAAHMDDELEKQSSVRCFAMYLGCACPSPLMLAAIRAGGC